MAFLSIANNSIGSTEEKASTSGKLWQKLLQNLKMWRLEERNAEKSVAAESHQQWSPLEYIDAKDAAHKLLDYCKNWVPEENLDATEYRKVLLEMIDVCATQRLLDRQLVRDILSALYWISGKIDRNALFWDCQKEPSESDTDLSKSLKNKQNYILEQVAGWAVDTRVKPFNRNAQANYMPYYLELPFAREEGEDGTSETQALSDALYNKQDPDLVITLLRCGVQPSCLYLWPVAKTLDLRLALSDTDSPDIYDWKEMEYIRHFSKARSRFSLRVINGDNKKDERAPGEKPGYHDTLLVPSRVKKHIPESLFKNPASLKHQCRLFIRQILLLDDNLPAGISKLPLPRVMLKYLDLNEN